MKNFVPLMTLLSFCCCSPFLDNPDALQRNRAIPVVYPEIPGPVVTADTVVWLTGVEVGGGYDWKRDTMAGNFHGRLVLLRNCVPVLKLDAGTGTDISADHDLHFIINGHVYSYLPSNGTSVVKRDGEPITSWVGYEYLKGLVDKDGDIHTLSDRKDGTLTYRKNGNVVMEISDAKVFGTMIDTSFPESGALYEQNGLVCFCYSATVAGERACYVVENGKSRQIAIKNNKSRITDLKVYDRKTFCFAILGDKGHLLNGNDEVSMPYSGMDCLNGTVTPGRGNMAGIRETGHRYGKKISDAILTDGTLWKHLEGDYSVCRGSGFPALYHSNADKSINIVTAAGDHGQVCDSCYLFSGKCTYSTETGDVWLAVTPYGRGEKPYIWKNGDTTQVDLNGYLTGIYVQISQSN